MGGRKNDEGKAPLWLVPWELLQYQVRPECHTGAYLLWYWMRKRMDVESIKTYFSPSTLERASKILAFGVEVYALDNWQEGFKSSRIASAGLRHATADMELDEGEQGSGKPHLWHLDCNLLFAWWQTLHKERYKDFDDRPSS